MTATLGTSILVALIGRLSWSEGEAERSSYLVYHDSRVRWQNNWKSTLALLLTIQTDLVSQLRVSCLVSVLDSRVRAPTSRMRSYDVRSYDVRWMAPISKPCGSRRIVRN